MDAMQESTIEKSGIIRNVIRLLPKEYQKTTQTEQDLVDLEHIKSEEGITDDDEADKIDAGCFLWDLSILPEQALFLADLQLIPILLRIISNPQHSSRLHEISLGILANLLTQSAVMQDTMQKQSVQLLDAIENSVMTNTDPMILRETFRIMTVGIYSKEDAWIQLAVTPDLMNQVLVVLQNTLNELLLESVANFLQWLFYYRTETIFPYLEIGTANCIIELLEQYTNENSPIKAEKSLEALLQILQEFSMQESFLQLLQESEQLKTSLVRCCKKIKQLSETEDEMEPLNTGVNEIVENLNINIS